ncbi:MAG: DUF4832 domain-containing protein [Clostridia bacterium]|nr:DUF4832 domain-containing protein [Clostridia bacterium]
MNSKRIFISAVALTLLCIVAMFILYSLFRFVDYTSAEYVEHTEALNNPYVGWYDIQLFRLSNDAGLDLSYFDSHDYGVSLVLVEIDLQNYRETPLSEQAIEQLDSLLSACRSNGKQVIIRFMYGSDGNSFEYEPEDISLIFMHMTQSSEIINQYTDCVYILQGLFVGAWGELHSSNHTSWDELRKLAHHLNRVLDPSIFLAVRTPEQWRMITGSSSPLSPAKSPADSVTARLSLFNDGMLGSETDLGTYAEQGTEDAAWNEDKRERVSEIAFQNVLCAYVPNGGEVVINNSFNDLDNAIDSLAETHVSYLNRGYDEAVLDKWAVSDYGGGDLYSGMNGYEYIARHLGYRYVVRATELIFPFPWLAKAQLSLQLENVGFAPAYRTFDVSLSMKNAETGAEYAVPVEADSRLWEAGEVTTLEIPLSVRTFTPGLYDLTLKISDPVTGFNISCANASATQTGGVSLGTLRIRQFPNL